MALTNSNTAVIDFNWENIKICWWHVPNCTRNPDEEGRRVRRENISLSLLETSPPGGVTSYVNWWYLWLQSYFQARPACLPERLPSYVCLRRIQWGSCYTQLFQLCLICPFAIPRPPHPSLVPSFIVPPSWAPFLPPSIRSITELWLSHFNIASGCNTQCLISLLKREGMIEIHFPSLQHPHSVTRCGPARGHRGVVL